ncbi:heat-inducible transcriptional repressor HrcA [Blastococcus sp. Marseille-P5729]|uniref:heat-inducible transcriptional repressor HrcA n=1 Tax=Blastococcus sp. Marseille-P5729 TaxID=2086582 RepID=UPI000D0F90EA|nr:heat-inducible transcriptional repressor HrcA [Blastococcus sp. Marseille-P5729]
MSADQRRLAVLRAVVEDFVSTNEPVGSKAIVERHGLGVSAATVRNDMAALEEEGYITHPHTSAGRIPTDKGYRLFVDRLDELRPMSSAERRAIERFIAGAVDLDDVLRRSVRLLSQLTRQAAVISYPSLSRSGVRHIEIVPVGATRIMVVVITDAGRVEQRVADLPDELAADDVAELRTEVNRSLVGKPLSASVELVETLPEEVRTSLRPAMAIICTLLIDALVEPADSRILVGGAANLTRHSADFHSSLGEVLEALEEHVVLLKLIDESNATAGVHVSIGAENPTPGLQSTSVVTAAYGEDGNLLGGLGVVGPTRMDYAGNIGAVMTVARYVSRLINSG